MSRYIPTDPLRIIYIVVVLIFDITVYMVLVIYLDRVLKSKFGVKKPWYYLFSVRYGLMTALYANITKEFLLV